MAEQVSPGIFRTPEARFEGLQDYPFEAHYKQIGLYRVHYLDEGPPDGETLLLLHGEPTWSYLYRKMIPVFTAAGYRVIAPDLVGFGKSDKPASKSDYSYSMQVDIVLQLVRQLNPQGVTFFGQDWGGLIGLRVVAAEPERFARVVVSNTGLLSAPGLKGWDKPFLVAFSDSDPITRGAQKYFLERVPGVENVTIEGAGHFVQEDAGQELAELMLDFMSRHPL